MADTLQADPMSHVAEALAMEEKTLIQMLQLGLGADRKGDMTMLRTKQKSSRPQPIPRRERSSIIMEQFMGCLNNFVYQCPHLRLAAYNL